MNYYSSETLSETFTMKLSLWNFTNPVLTTWQTVSELVIEFIEVVHGFTFQLLWNGRLSLEALKDTLPLCILCILSLLLLLLLLLSLLCQVRINNKPRPEGLDPREVEKGFTPKYWAAKKNTLLRVIPTVTKFCHGFRHLIWKYMWHIISDLLF